MKYIDEKQRQDLLSEALGEDETFCFRCHPQLACFTRCCRNLTLFLYPYDVLKLKNSLGISSDRFLEQHTEMVLRRGNYFPDVVLSMSEDEEKTCPFLTSRGCSVYPDRPDTCRTFPLEQGILFEGPKATARDVYFFRPPPFCLGRKEADLWTATHWEQDQEAVEYHRMTRCWAELKAFFQNNPWGSEGVSGKKGKMALMATYNLDRFREFVFGSTFLKRFKVKKDVLKKIEADEVSLMLFGFEWVKFFVWGIRTKHVRPRA